EPHRGERAESRPRWRSQDDGIRDNHARPDRSRSGRGQAADRRRARVAEPVSRPRARGAVAAGGCGNAELARTRHTDDLMRKDIKSTTGAVHRLTLESSVLKGNLLGDPTERTVDVYIPAGHDGRGLPLLVDLVGFTAGGPAHTNWKNFGENLPERLDRLIGSGAMAPCVVALPHCFTKLGGNQYINCSVIGPWADFLREESVPFVEQRFGCGGNGGRGCFGKSSGGYGAMVHAMLHPDFWSAAASHSGDVGFTLLFTIDFPKVLRALATADNSIQKWL